MKLINKEVLEDLYLTQELNPYQIGQLLACNHKTIRSYLRKYHIPMRSASEYNFLARKNYISPTDDLLLTPLSIAAHTAYLCEGWHTDKTNHVYFCNQDPTLIDLIKQLLVQVYKVKTYRIEIAASNKDTATSFLDLYPQARFQLDHSRKNPIIKLISGGKMLSRDLVKNAYKLIHQLTPMS
jgi:hypothetical protein